MMRMSVKAFEELVELVRPLIMRTYVIREPISVEERLAITIKYLASGSSQVEVARNFRIGDSTIPRIISETCQAIWTVLMGTVMPAPDKEKFLEVAKGFEQRWNFPNVIGAIDGKHVNIQAPPNSGSSHYNYKGQHSTVLLAVCDYRYRFLMVDIGAEGRRSDGGIFAASVFGKAFENKTLDIPLPDVEGECPYYMVGDAAFPLSLYLLKPYPGKLFDDERKSTFNYRLSRARRTIENTFGILAAKWRIYRSPIQACLELDEFAACWSGQPYLLCKNT